MTSFVKYESYVFVRKRGRSSSQPLIRSRIGSLFGRYNKQRIREVPEMDDFDGVFTSWNTSWESVASKGDYSLENQNAFISVELEHDHHVYRSDVKVTHFYRDKKRERMLTIDLPNNGFLYPCPHELKVFKSTDFPHCSSNNMKLDALHLAKSPRMIDFAKEYLSSTSVSCKMFYNCSSCIFDFKIYNQREGTDSVCFSFRHLNNVDHEIDDDYWLDA